MARLACRSSWTSGQQLKTTREPGFAGKSACPIEQAVAVLRQSLIKTVIFIAETLQFRNNARAVFP
jgi:hypothetical protein